MLEEGQKEAVWARVLGQGGPGMGSEQVCGEEGQRERPQEALENRPQVREGERGSCLHSPGETELEGRRSSCWEQEQAARRRRAGQGAGARPRASGAHGLGPDGSLFGRVLRSAQRLRAQVDQLGALSNPDPEALEVASQRGPSGGACPRRVL